MSSLRERVLNRIINDAQRRGAQLINPHACAEDHVNEMTKAELLEAVSDALEELIEDLAKEKTK